MIQKEKRKRRTIDDALRDAKNCVVRHAQDGIVIVAGEDGSLGQAFAPLPDTERGDPGMVIVHKGFPLFIRRPE